MSFISPPLIKGPPRSWFIAVTIAMLGVFIKVRLKHVGHSWAWLRRTNIALCVMQVRAGPIKSSDRSTSAANVGSRSPGKTHAEKIGFAALLVSLL